MNPLLSQERKLVGCYSWSFFGSFCQQKPEALVSLNRLLLNYDFARIIELGSHLYGLSTLFALYCYGSQYPIWPDNEKEPGLVFNQTQHKHPRDFHTFDNVCRDRNRLELLRGLGAKAELRDFLENPEDIEYIKGIIPSDGRTLLLCDGGNKKRELDIYAGSLRRGDIVMLHDWAYDEKAFERLKMGGWSSWEVRWQNGGQADQQFGIKDICEREGITQIFPEEFDQAAWFAGVKT